MNWTDIPEEIQRTLWSWKSIPTDYERAFHIFPVEVEPLYEELSSSGDFDSCQVYDDDAAHFDVDLSRPIIIDKRFNNLQSNVADGLHRIMAAHHKGIKTIPAVDVTPMFLDLGLPQASNKYPTHSSKRIHDIADDLESD